MTDEPQQTACRPHRCRKAENTLGLVVLSAAVLITAWKGNVDYMSLALLAVLFKLPGTRRIANLFSKGDDDAPAA